MSTCSVFAWCENNHADLRVPASEHEKHVNISWGGSEETVLLELIDGKPRMEWSAAFEVWLEPAEDVNSFVELRNAIDQMISTYEAFKVEAASRG